MITKKDIFPLHVGTFKDANGKPILKTNTDENTSYWTVAATGIQFQETVTDDNQPHFTIEIPHERTQYAGMPADRVPNSYLGAQRYSFSMSK